MPIVSSFLALLAINSFPIYTNPSAISYIDILPLSLLISLPRMLKASLEAVRFKL